MEQTRKRSIHHIVWMILIAALVCVALFAFYRWTAVRGSVYAQQAQKAAEAGDWDRAERFAAQAERYGENDLQNAITQKKAEALIERGDYTEAIALLSDRKDDPNAAALLLACTYGLAEQAQAQGDFAAARDGFTAAAGYRDALIRADACRYALAEQKLLRGDTEGAFRDFLALGTFSDARERAVAAACELTGETDTEAALLLAQGLGPQKIDEMDRLKTRRDSLTSHRLAAGHAQALFLCADGTVRYAGDNASVKAETEGWTNIVAVSAGYAHLLGLTSDGRVLAAGDDSCGQCGVAQWTDVAAIVCGPWDSYGLRTDGTVLCCGYRSEQSVAAGWTDVTALSAGESALFAVRANGTLLTDRADGLRDWHNLYAVCPTGMVPVGLDTYGNVLSDDDTLSDWTDVIAVDSSAALLVALRADGTLLCRALLPNQDALMNELCEERNVTGISAAGTYVLLLHEDGSVSAPGAPFDVKGLQE